MFKEFKELNKVSEIRKKLKIEYILYYIISIFLEVGTAFFLFSLVDILLNNDLQVSYKYILIYIFFISLMILTKYLRIKTSKKITYESYYTLSSKYVDAISCYEYEKILECGSSKALAIMNNNLEKIKEFYVFNLDGILYRPVLFILVSIAIFIHNKYIAIFLIPLIVITSFINVFSGKNIGIYSKKVKKNTEDLISFQNEIVNNKENIYLSNAKEFVKMKYDETAKNVYNSEKNYAKVHAINYLPSLINEYIPIALFFAISFFESINKTINYGIFVSNLRLISMISLPFSRYLRQIIHMKSIAPYSKSFIKEIKKYYNKNNYDKFEINDLEDIVNVNDITFKYKEKNIIENLSFKVKKGEKVAIIGDPGSGKTTVLKILLGFINNYSGSVKVFGNEIKNIDKNKYYNIIGYMDNSRIKFFDNVYENIAMDKKYNKEKVKKIIEDLNIDFINCENLSGGENMLINFSRLIYKDPLIYILDEPVSSSDAIKESIIMNYIKNSDKTVILTTHRLNNIDLFNKIINMKVSK